MVNPSIQQALSIELDRLPPELQARVLEFARALALGPPKGAPGAALLRLADTIDPRDLAAMAEAIEEACEQVDAREW